MRNQRNYEMSNPQEYNKNARKIKLVLIIRSSTVAATRSESSPSPTETAQSTGPKAVTRLVSILAFVLDSVNMVILEKRQHSRSSL